MAVSTDEKIWINSIYKMKLMFCIRRVYTEMIPFKSAWPRMHMQPTKPASLLSVEMNDELSISS